MYNISNFLFIACLFLSTSAYSQKPESPQNTKTGFVSPLDIPLLLSSNYGEYRSGHFHAGVDFKTQQVEGKKVFAADSGYVYRIAVLLWGYGNVIYIKHPSGKITVYGHLSKFVPALEQYVKEQQYRKKSYTVDLLPDPGKFVFRRGELIGLSGNSGGSFGAHLHFEVRNETGTIPLNPLNYGFAISDRTSPRMNWLMVYPLGKESLVNGFKIPLPLQVRRRNNNYYILPDTLLINGAFGVGIETYDFLDNSLNECEPNTIEMLLDKQQIFYSVMDSIPFSMGGYLNSYFDYGELLRTGRKIQKLFIDPNNKLNIYKNAVNRGSILLNDSTVHEIRIVVKDTYGNQSTLNFYVKRHNSIPVNSSSQPDPITAKFAFDSLNVYETSNIKIAIPANALFEDLDFKYQESENDSFQYSLLHCVHNNYTPLLVPYIISVKTRGLSPDLYEKAFLAIRKTDNKWVSEGGDYKNGFITLRTKNFGQFIVMIDTVKPEIHPLKFSPGAKYEAGQTISFTIADTLSGISKYAGTIDNKWALFEYDAKNDLFSYTIDGSRLKKDSLHQIEIIVTDYRENLEKYTNSFYY
jgi:hypothetical protein